jgi:hypothetical protein
MDVSPVISVYPQFRINNPTLRYQLDPCEPGMLRSAPASQSIAAVSAQERGNLNQFRREALLAGRIVVYASITFTRSIDGIFPSIRAGRTEVVSVPLPESGAEPPPDEPISENTPPVEVEIDAEDDDISSDELELLSTLSAIRRQLEMEKSAGENGWNEITSDDDLENIKGLDMEILSAEESEEGDGLPLPNFGEVETEDEEHIPFSASGKADDNEQVEMPGSLSREEIRYQEKMREIQHLLNELRIRRLSENIQQLNDVLSGVIKKNVDLASKLVKVANRVGPNSHFPDLSLSSAVLGASLDFRT